MSEPEWFITEDLDQRWWEWGERIARAVGDAATRVGSALIAGLGAIGGAQLFRAGHGDYAKIVLGVSALFVVIFAVSALLPTARR